RSRATRSRCFCCPAGSPPAGSGRSSSSLFLRGSPRAPRPPPSRHTNAHAAALILRDTIANVRLRGAVWAMTTFLAPGVLLAFHIYPNAFGAAAIGFAYRFGVTAPARRPLLAGIAAGLTLFLNPRDGLVLARLVVRVWWAGWREFRRFAIGAVAVALVAAIANAFL